MRMAERRGDIRTADELRNGARGLISVVSDGRCVFRFRDALNIYAACERDLLFKLCDPPSHLLCIGDDCQGDMLTVLDA